MTRAAIRTRRVSARPPVTLKPRIGMWTHDGAADRAHRGAPQGEAARQRRTIENVVRAARPRLPAMSIGLATSR
jgi:hypothetical protein